MRDARNAVAILTGILAVTCLRAEPVSFRKEIAPILQENCLSCHSGAKPKGDLDLSTPEGLKAGEKTAPLLYPVK